VALRLNAGNLPPLVLMTDDERLPDPCAAARALPRGSLIVLRARDRQRRRELAAELARIARAQALFLLIADDTDLARLAHGVHFPEARMGEIAHWRARRPDWFVTTSAHSLAAAQRAARFGATAVFLSPVFPTESHPGRAPLTPIRLRLMAQEVHAPLYALGGINASNAQQLAGARLAGIAAIGGLAV
jgi:thiamine-phosphate pyrophosphorylase